MRLGRSCGKCGGQMEPGFLAQHFQSDEGRQIAWHPGEPRPEQVNFLGIDVTTSWAVRIDSERLEPITQYRCASCGYLEAYAL